MAQHVHSYTTDHGTIAIGDKVHATMGSGYQLRGTVTDIIESGPSATFKVQGDKSGKIRAFPARLVTPR